MNDKVSKPKMKIVGYSCLAFAAIIAILILIGISKSESDVLIMQFWAGTGVTLLFGNAAKRIVGTSQMAKQIGKGK